MSQVLLQIAVAVFLILLVLHFLRPRWNLRIVVRDGAVDVQGRALTGRRGVVSDFFQKDMPEIRRARVDGYWDGRRLRLRCHGGLSPGQQQRVRNFLLTTL
jgi:membrane protein implicated in regulation of membrane protease activity